MELIKDKEWIEKFEKLDTIPYSQGEYYHNAKACFEIAKQYAASIQDKNAGVWVKASERLPDKGKKVNGRLFNEPAIILNHELHKSYITANGNLEFIENVKWLDESQSNNGWISVKDKLPEPHIFVLVYVPTREMAFMAIRADRGLYGEQWESKYEEIFEGITHWMPLPTRKQ